MKNSTLLLDNTIKKVVNKLVKLDISQVKSEFSKIFFSRADLITHFSDKWEQHQGDFFNFYLNVDDTAKRELLQYFGVNVSPDKYNSSEDRALAILFGHKKVYDIFPLETELLTQFCLMGNNHSLDFLKEIDSSGKCWDVVVSNKIDLFGCSENWLKLWELSSEFHKDLITEYLLKQ